MGYKRATGEEGMAGVNTTHEPKNKGSVTASDGPKSHPSQESGGGNMGASEHGGTGRISQGGDPGGFAAGRSRTDVGRNSAGAGRPQAFKG